MGKLQDHLYFTLERRGVLSPLTLGSYRASRRTELLTSAYRDLHQPLELSGMRSWTTVGTPFLCHLPREGLFGRGWRHAKYSIGGDVTAKDVESPIGPVFLYLAGVISFLLALVVAAAPGSGLSWPSRLISATVGLVIFSLARRVGKQRHVAHSLTIRAKLARSAFAHFSGRWLGLSAPTDEAIIGLRALCPSQAPDYTQLRQPPTQRSCRHDPTSNPLQVPTLLRLNAPLTEIHLVPEVLLSGGGPTGGGSMLRDAVYGGINRWIMPKLNRTLAAQLLRSAQGCDVPYTDLVYVSTWPVPTDQGTTGLPDRVAQALESDAVSHASLLGPEVRQMIARVSLSGARLSAVLADNRLSIAGRALVHTSYFDNLDVLYLVRQHIAAQCETAGDTAAHSRAPEDARTWLAENREHVARTIGG